MDIWSQIFAENFCIIFKVCVCMNRGKAVQPNVDRCGQWGRGSKITENVWIYFMDGP